MLRIFLILLAAMTGPVLAETSTFRIGQDRYQVGADLNFVESSITDLFMAGNSVVVAAPILGSANLAGRRISVTAAIASDLYAMGYSVEVTAPIGGNANVTGYDIRLGPVGGNLRVGGSDVVVQSVGGYALITGANVTLNGAVSGDVIIAAGTVTFGPTARVAGALTIYAEDPASIIVPASVAPAERVKIELRENYNPNNDMAIKVPFWQMALTFLGGVLISGLIAALVIAIAPKAVQNWRTLALAHPSRAIWSGFLITSALAGSGFVLMLTIVGIILFPVMVILTILAIFAGYALGSYVLGVGLWRAMGRPVPERLMGKFALACLGAFVAGLAWFVPIAGWLFVLALTMLGIGTLAAFALPGGFLLRRDPVALAV